MRKFKKVLAVVMVMAFLMSCLPLVSASAFDPLSPVQLQLDTPVEVQTDSYLPVEFVPEKDGWYKFYSTGEYDTYASLFDSYGDEIEYGDDTSDTDDLNFVISAKLQAGETYYLEVGTYDGEGSVTVCVTVTETIGVEGLEITQLPYNTTVFEGYEEDTYSCEGLEVRFTLSDGSTVDWSYDNDGEMVEDIYVYVYCVYGENGEFSIAVECGDAYEEIPYTIVENPVESIEYKCDTAIEFYANSNGYFDDMDNQYYYSYVIPEDAVLVINYNDGTSEELGFYDVADEMSLNVYDDQYENAWDVGTHYVTISYYDVTVDVPVTILPSPFKSVTVNSQPTREYIFGDYETGYYEDGEYWFAPFDLSGMSFTVEYEDGTTQTFDDDDFDMDFMTIDGYEYTISTHTVYGAGEVDAVLYYKGEEIAFTTSVIETHIESIEVVKPPVKAEFEDYYYGDYTGAVIKINYKDGTSAQAEANEDTMYYEYYGDVVCKIRVGDDVVSIYNELDFETGVMDDYITCAGVGLNYDGVTYIESREVDSIEAENVTMSGDGMIITVHYLDGTSEQLVFDVLDYMINEDEYTEACAMTQNGVLSFAIEKWHYENSDEEKYAVYVFDNSVAVDVEPEGIEGDVDGDGVVSVMDATSIQLHLAQMETLDEAQLKLADTDNDGKISVMDATQIQLFLAQMLPEL